jgi:hypothetical protein
MKRRYEDLETGAFVHIKRDCHGRDDIRWLSKVACPARKQGEGGATRAMKAVCEDADREGLQLRLVIIPRPNTDVRRRLLREWYSTFGFYGIEEMARYPGGELPTHATSGVGWPD